MPGLREDIALAGFMPGKSHLENFRFHSFEKQCILLRLHNTGGCVMYAQRNKDRRSFGGKTSFPMKTKEGCLVEKERRSLPDRRLGNIHLEIVYAGDNKLPEYLTNTSLSPAGKKMK